MLYSSARISATADKAGSRRRHVDDRTGLARTVALFSDFDDVGPDHPAYILSFLGNGPQDPSRAHHCRCNLSPMALAPHQHQQ